MTEPRFWSVVPAAGVGRRMAAAMPKQYLPLAGSTVIEHTLERLLEHPRLDGVYVALGEEDGYWQSIRYADHPDVVRVIGGAERVNSVYNALLALASRASLDDFVLVHDAARPCIRRSDIDKLIDGVIGHPGGGLLAVPVHDTMKRAKPPGRVVETLDRSALWRAFTPQMFRLGSLRDALSSAMRGNSPITDESSAMELAGYQPLLVEGHTDNIKITRPEDLPLAEFYLQAQARSEDSTELA